LVIEGDTWNPSDAIIRRDERQTIPFVSRHSPVDQQILEPPMACASERS